MYELLLVLTYTVTLYYFYKSLVGPAACGIRQINLLYFHICLFSDSVTQFTKQIFDIYSIMVINTNYDSALAFSQNAMVR